MLSYKSMRRAKTILEKKHIPLDKLYSKPAQVAYDVIGKLKRGEKINKVDIAVKNGYSMASALSQKPYNTKTYKAITTTAIDQMQRIREKALNNLETRNFSKESMYDVLNASKTMTHDTQLLQGKSTENNNQAPTILVYGSNDFLAMQISKQKEIKDAHYKEIEATPEATA